MGSPHDRFGRASLFFASVGLLLLVLDVLAVRFTIPWITSYVVRVNLIVSIVSQIAALGFGFAAGGTVMGRAGLVVALVSLALFLGFCCSMLGALSFSGVH